MPRKPTNTKSMLLETTVQQIESIGTERISLRKIAAECGVTHATVYKYFKNKQDLIEACYPYIYEKMLPALRRAAKGAQEPFVEVCKAFAVYMHKHPHYHRLLYFNPTTRSLSPTIESLDRITSFTETADDFFRRCGIPELECPTLLSAVFTVLHGLLALLHNQSIEYVGDLGDLVQTLVFDQLKLNPLSPQE